MGKAFAADAPEAETIKPVGGITRQVLEWMGDAEEGESDDMTMSGHRKNRSAYASFKSAYIPYYAKKHTTTGFWVRKTVLMLETLLSVSLAVLIAAALEVLGFVRFFSIFFHPLLKMGRIASAAAPAFFAALRKASIANGILVAARDNGRIDNRQLYTSVLVSSSLSNLGHLPTYILAIGMVCGTKAMAVVTGVRLGSIAAQIVVILALSAWMTGLTQKDPAREQQPEEGNLTAPFPGRHGEKMEDGFFREVWRRSAKTIRRLSLFFGAAFMLVSLLEFAGFFEVLGDRFPWLFHPSFLPPQASVIIPAQAVGIFSGTAAVAGFIQDGILSVKQAVTILLVGSFITAPIRTLKRILPTYIGMLGLRPGIVLAVSAQVIRMSFLAVATWIMWLVW